MSTEPEYTTHTRLTVSIPHEDAMKLVRAGVGQTDERQWAGNHSAADLLDALDAVPTADMARVIREAQCEANRWQTAAEENERWADEWRRKASASSAFRLHSVTRAEEAEAEALEQAKLVRTWADRAEKAEALVARVQRLRDASGDTVGVEELDAILDPKPEFTLPTDPGVRFTAKHSSGGDPTVFQTFSNGDEAVYIAENAEETFWVARDVLSDFTDHRLIGADQ